MRRSTLVTDGDQLREVLAAAAEGDDAAMTAFVRRTQSEVWRLCSLLGSADDVDDLVQDTYVRALGSARTYRGESSVRSWLFAIARNTCADHVRQRQRRRRVLDAVRSQRPRAHTSDVAITHHLLAGLAPDRREAFVMTQLLGLSYEEAAAALDCPIGTIRSRVARARTDLAAAELGSQIV